MRSKPNRHILLLVSAFMIASFMASPPSGSTVHPLNLSMTEGSINVDNTMFEVPGGGIPGCPSLTSIVGSINATTGATTVSLGIIFPLIFPIDGEDYVIEASTTTATHGTYNAGSGGFSGAHLIMSFMIYEFIRGDCLTGTTICAGTITITLGGGLYGGANLPLGTGGELYVNGIGSITSVPLTGCDVSWWLLLIGADFSISENTTIGTSPGALFVQA